jgi:hypothetical protein
MKESASGLRPFGFRVSWVMSPLSLLNNGQNSGVILSATVELVLWVRYEKEDLGLKGG